MQTIEQRMTSLERSVKMWRLVAILPVLAVIVMANTESDVEDEIRAKAFVVVTDGGEELVRMDDFENRGRLLVSYGGGDWTIALAASKEQGGSLLLYAPDGETAGVVAIGQPDDLGRGYVAVADAVGDWVWSTPME